MKRILLLLALAIVLPSCSKDTPADPDDAVPSSWEGRIRFMRHSTTAELDETVLIEGPVIFEVDPDTVPLGGGASYSIRPGSRLTASHTGRIGNCTISGGNQFTLPGGSGFLNVQANGSYAGAIHSETTFASTVSCPGIGSVSLGEDKAAIDLIMAGSVTALRVKGDMPVLTVASSNFTGSWDLVQVFPNR